MSNLDNFIGGGLLVLFGLFGIVMGLMSPFMLWIGFNMLKDIK